MKFFRQMTSEERVQYVGSFSRWYANRDQISLCVQQTGGLDADARTNFDTGVSLMQAWPFRDQLNSSVNSIPAARCVPMLMRLSDQVKAQMGELPTTTKDPVIDPKQAPLNPRTPDASNPRTLDNSNNREDAKQHSAAPSPIPSTGTLHIDQILYLLSPEVAERAKSIKAKLDERDINSNRAKDLAIEGASNDAIAPFAKAASDAQQFVTDTFAMIDDELAEYVAAELYMRTHKVDDDNLTPDILSNCSKPFGSIDRFIAALTPYYNKANENGRIDRRVAQRFENGKQPTAVTDPVSDASPSVQSSPSPGEATPTYDTAEYKRIWTYVNRKDVAHTQKRLEKMRAEIDAAKNAGMPNIDAMEAIYAKEAELVLEEQQKALNDGEPSLL